MTIPEAIKILQERHRIGDPLKSPDYENALKLGIEGLKQVQFYRSIPDGKCHNLLQGETERSSNEPE